MMPKCKPYTLVPDIMGTERSGISCAPILEINGLDVYYGQAHAVQGVSLRLDRGVLGVVGRNGMGKTTLCKAITGLVPATGSIKVAGEEVRGLSPNRITKICDSRKKVRGGAGGRSAAFMKRSQAWRSAAAMVEHNFQAANSRCWPSAAHCCSTRFCW
jgi:ABC-type glutathione transport system ATPase component